ncbi:VWA domain-containing protein [Planctomycetota bacterium]
MKMTNPSNKLTIMLLAAIVSCLILPASFAYAEKVYFSDDFENGLVQWQAAGDTWQLTDLFYRSTNHSASDSPQGDYPANANSTMAMKLNYRIDLSNSTHPILTFWHKIGVYSSDYGYVEISDDYGDTWKVIESFTNTWRSTWSFVQVPLNEYISSSILIRFRLRTSGRDQSWGWDIDDVEIKEKDMETIPFPFFDDFESGLTNWMLEEGNAWQLTELLFRDPNHCISEIPGGGYTSHACSDLILANPIDLSSSVDPVLTFWYQIGVYNEDHGYIHISEDGGTTWSELKDYTNMWRSTWSFEQIDLSAYTSTPILIRFRLRASGRDQSWGWDIDDVEIKEKDMETIPFPFFDDFESGLDNWMLEEGDAWQLSEEVNCPSSTHFISESPEGNYPSRGSSDLLLVHPIALSSSVNPRLTFWHKIGIYNGDHGYIHISEDGGTTWSELKDFTNIWYSTWSYEQIDLSAYTSTPILIRFRLRASGRDQSWGWDIDDVMIKELFYHPCPLLVQITDVDTSYCPEIQAAVIVTDMNDEAITDLDASNFSVYENSILQSPVTVEPYSSSVCASLALDYSGSMEPAALEALEIAAIGFVDLMIPGDRGEIIKFAKGIEVMQEFTDDKNVLIDAIQRATSPDFDSSATSFYDAIYQAISDASEQPCDSRVVIAMSDGRDNHSQPEHSATAVIDHASAMDIPVFTIGLGDEVDADKLIAIATETGGIYYFAPTPEDLAATYQKIAGTLNAQYIVKYNTTICDPNSSGDVEHELNIEVLQGTAYGQGTRRFRCPVLSDPNMVSDYDTDSFDLTEHNLIPLVFND